METSGFFFIMNSKEYVKLQLTTLGVKPESVARQLGISEAVFNYMLQASEELDTELYEKILSILTEFQYELNFNGLEPENPDEHPELFEQEGFHLIIGERIRLFARNKYGTLKNLAIKMNMSPQQLQQYLNGNREPGARVLYRLMRAGCDINWLLGGAENYEVSERAKLESELFRLKKLFEKVKNVIEDAEKK
ncbi:MAG: helix-turn-helix transcriptional regulator [Ignavibacteriales bacterium]|nr:helix-turn-helix transcriptional regulator [Ignavibacteriales bacterium]MCF8314720.1 helix-turn-helix transcriptional regulator [Ignavibacteriales bacterium]MCF8438032.1 helix-turn-helix transcriptional regulator [Ignavibacteriales bacterium]